MSPPLSPRWTVALTLALTAACARDGDTERKDPMTDVHSHARPDKVRVSHLHLDLRADFEARILGGEATLTLDRTDASAPLILDTDGLAIGAVVDQDRAPLEHEVGDAEAVLGAPLVVELRDDTTKVSVEYSTAPDAAAVQWLEPSQTSGDHPYLFTQGQAILTRSWIPCQDTPGVRATYSARITVPSELTAVMSARKTNDGELTEIGRAFEFELDRPVPSYLIALAIGDLEFRALSDRAGVYAEPEVVEAAAHEFADTEKMIAAAERLYGPYRWGRYDILVLPPAFPFGGMENPCLTFATPTIIAGDRSLTSLVAHELAHSWSGNLVTNGVWADLWLNEGFTVYFENRIMAELYGDDYAQMLRALGWQDLAEDIAALGERHPDTKLHPNLAGRNPDDAFSDVPYEKGALFLRTIDRAVGRERFDAFLRRYFEEFAFQSMTSDRFLDYLEANLFAADPDGWKALGAREWVYGAGLPDNAVEPKSDAFARVDAIRAEFLDGASAASLAGPDRFSTHEWLHFLRGLSTLDEERLDDLDETFSFTASGNSEIKFEWLRICIQNRREAAFPALREFLVRVGRRKFLKPLYQELARTDWGKELAREIYREARPGYHAVSFHTIDSILGTDGR